MASNTVLLFKRKKEKKKEREKNPLQKLCTNKSLARSVARNSKIYTEHGGMGGWHGAAYSDVPLHNVDGVVHGHRPYPAAREMLAASGWSTEIKEGWLVLADEHKTGAALTAALDAYEADGDGGGGGGGGGSVSSKGGSTAGGWAQRVQTMFQPVATDGEAAAEVVHLLFSRKQDRGFKDSNPEASGHYDLLQRVHP